MPRRAKTGLQPIHYIGIAVFIGVVALIGIFLLGHKSEAGYGGIPELNVADYYQNSNALSNNTYRFDGVIGERLDNWRSADGRLFNVLVEEGAQASPVPVRIPSKFNGTNMQRGERFRFKATVEAETGILVVQEMSRT
ncbi:MAG TPA: hypothetical protein VHI52_20555 [Verrucomicrobiae bacterium]|nr:hypothetical protein [Verrucomicrobiae bacterium]